ncbi:MAG: hypothetical protein HQ564_00710 [Candidatus Saganbacteria bacterium]|nr:hypothetical protein [Candidatus Saganbacteria bacterium]
MTELRNITLVTPNNKKVNGYNVCCSDKKCRSIEVRKVKTDGRVTVFNFIPAQKPKISLCKRKKRKLVCRPQKLNRKVRRDISKTKVEIKQLCVKEMLLETRRVGQALQKADLDAKAADRASIAAKKVKDKPAVNKLILKAEKSAQQAGEAVKIFRDRGAVCAAVKLL